MSRFAGGSASAFFQYDAPSAAVEDTGFLAECSPEGWKTLTAHCDRRRFRAGERIVAAGEQDRSLLIVLEGDLRAQVATGKRVQVLATSPPGSVVGELGFLDGLPRSVDVVAGSDGELLRLTHQRFEAMAAADPALGRLVLADLGRIVSLRVRRLTDRLAGG